MGIASYEGRLAALTVALGIGAAAVMQYDCGLVWADTSGSTSSASNSSSTSPATAGSAQSGTATQTPKGPLANSSTTPTGSSASQVPAGAVNSAGPSRPLSPGPVLTPQTSDLSDIIKSLPIVSTFFNPPAKPKSTAPSADSQLQAPTASSGRVDNRLPAVSVAPKPFSLATVTATATPAGPQLMQPASPVGIAALKPAPVTTLTAATTTALAPNVTTPSAAVISTPAVTSAPVSPIAEIFALPARIVNAVLGLIGITPATATTPTPISPAPIVQVLFAVFREFENLMGLDTPPAVQPVLTTQTFTGSLTTPTPTVAQLLDAATAEYVLGGTPAGLTPFVVNGLPVTYTNDFTGTSAQVWVTPQNQIIIAYQGTTGGTNLLFNPLIAITQTLDDAQAVLTQTTPPAFPDALRFAQQVEAEAAAQGYTTDNIFVTGHSLGGWQAEYVAQNTGLGGIGFESPGLNTTVPGNGADSLFVNTATYGDPASFSSDVPSTQPFGPAYVPGGGTYPHYGPIVMLGDPTSQYPLTNALALWGTSIVGDLIALVVGFGNFFEFHLPSVQAYSLDVDLSPALLPGSGVYTGPVRTGFGDLTIPEFLQAASVAGILIAP